MEEPSLRSADGNLLPARIELQESSGPVSPRYQYETYVLVEAKDGKLTLHYKDRGAYRQGVPARNADVTVDLPVAVYERLWEELRARDVFQRTDDLIGEERRQRVGISFNSFQLKLGDAETRFDYLTSLLDDPDEKRAPYRAIIAAMKRLCPGG